MFSKIVRQRLDVFLKFHATADKILNVGAGRDIEGGNYINLFPNQISVDIDENRKPDVIGDIRNLPFADGEFGTVLCTEVLEHVPEPEKAVRELYRVTKKGGKLILTTRFVYPIHDAPHDYYRYTKYNLARLFADWTEVDIIPESKSFSTIAILLQRICFQSRLRFNKPTKLIIFLIAKFLARLDFLIMAEYADIKKSAKESEIMSTGYYVVAKK
jgi:SAM-dependent methyltransferase